MSLSFFKQLESWLPNMSSISEETLKVIKTVDKKINLYHNRKIKYLVVKNDEVIPIDKSSDVKVSILYFYSKDFTPENYTFNLVHNGLESEYTIPHYLISHDDKIIKTNIELKIDYIENNQNFFILKSSDENKNIEYFIKISEKITTSDLYKR